MSTTGTILLVTIEPEFKRVVSEALQQDGHLVLQCATAGSALESYSQTHPDLILVDVELPGASGIDLCRQLIETYGEECAPIIFFATSPAPTDIAVGFGAGATDYFIKTSSTEEIRARVRSHLSNYVLMKEQKAMVEQLSRANAAKNRFIGMAAHDMRNPLVSIRGFAEFLLDGTMGPMPSVQLALVSIIHGTSNLMIKTLNELLDVATIEAGQLKLQVSSHSLIDLIAKSAAQAQLEARKKRSRIEVDNTTASPVLTIDGDKIKQVADNLLSNAIKFSPPASLIRVRVAVDAASSTCTFAVRDQGPGIPDSAREKLFKPGGMASESTSDEKSAGLGLVICRNIVDAHRGRIDAENLAGGGCEFRVTLPLPT